MTRLMGMPQNTKDYYRYCPGEEHIRISNAICRGRRKSHFPKCHNCQFNDDQHTQAPLQVERKQVETPSPAKVINGQIVGNANPTEGIGALFHASEVAGTVPAPMSDEAAWRIGHAAAQFLRAKLRGYDRADPDANSLVIGRDPRSHSPRLERALIEGVRATGTDVITLGIIDTPQLYFAVERIGACGGIMVSAGHRPTSENGFRICGLQGTPIGMDTGLGSIRDIAIRVPVHTTGANSRKLERDDVEAYTDFIRGVLHARNKLPRPIKVVVDASNGSAARWIPLLFKGMRNLRIIKLNFEHEGEFHHEPNPLKSRNLQQMRQVLRDEDADFAVCFDASAERCVFIDDRARTVRPDYMIALLANNFLARDPDATIVFDHRASAVTEEEILRVGGKPMRERIGPAYIKRAMTENEAVFAGDLAGRFYFRETRYCESAFLAFAHVLNLLGTNEQPLSELIKPLQRYSNSGEIEFQCADTERALTELSLALSNAREERFDGVTYRFPDWWVNVRPNAARGVLRVNMEARNRKQIDEKLEELGVLLGERM